MEQRWTAKIAILASWAFLLSACAGYGVAMLALNLGADNEWAAIAGMVAFTSNILMLDHWLSVR